MPSIPSPMGALDRVRREVERNALRARNGIRMTTGISQPVVGQAPKDVVWRRGRCELWHYRNDSIRVSPPLLIVFSLVSRSYILDLTPGNSFIEHLLAAGFDVYLLDWGVPDERDAANRLEDYVDAAIPAAIAQVCRRAGTGKVNLLGYCFGGVLTLLHAAHHLYSPLHSLTVMATPVDFTQLGRSATCSARPAWMSSQSSVTTATFRRGASLPPSSMTAGVMFFAAAAATAAPAPVEPVNDTSR